MPAQFQNYDYKYKMNGKPVFAPSDQGREIGKKIKKQLENKYRFDDFFYHLKKGGHVAALHAHRQNRYFCKLDIKNFFYSVARNRITKRLKSLKIKGSQSFAQWSCVKNPFGNEPNYVLPYGFVQSPILATLVMAKSPLGDALRQMPENVTTSVYVDDIVLSSNDLDTLNDCYTKTRTAIIAANLEISETKAVAPQEQILVFNCDMQNRITVVTQERIDEFYNSFPSPASIDGFERYLDSVRTGNA